jgi:ubiquinol-cytochrome c reductase cytochrome b subunit
VRTAIGVGTLTFYVVLFLAGSQDIGAQKLVLPIPTLTRVFQVMVVVLPLLAALMAWKLCRDLSGGDELESRKDHIRHGRGDDGRPEQTSGGTGGEERPARVFRVAAGAATTMAALRRALGGKAPTKH